MHHGWWQNTQTRVLPPRSPVSPRVPAGEGRPGLAGRREGTALLQAIPAKRVCETLLIGLGTRQRWLVFLKVSLHGSHKETQLYKSGKAKTTAETAAFSEAGVWAPAPRPTFGSEQRGRPMLRLCRRPRRHQRARCFCWVRLPWFR